MRFNKGIAIAILFYTMLVSIFIGVLLFPGWLVSQIDGNEGTHNINLSTHHKIYLDAENYKILKEIAPDLGEVLVMDMVDSLCWNDSLIIGFSNGKYFRIKSSKKSLDLGYIKAGENKGDFHIFYKKPGLSGFRIKDTIYD